MEILERDGNGLLVGQRLLLAMLLRFCLVAVDIIIHVVLLLLIPIKPKPPAALLSSTRRRTVPIVETDSSYCCSTIFRCYGGNV
jgi:hypothetical protein